jgi:uncharacterized membrane protein
MLLLTIAQATILTTALVEPVNTITIVTAALALLFILMGNYMAKTRPNFFAGIRTPWTLSSDFSWEKTHRLGGRLLVATGAITLIVLVAVGARPAMEILLSLLFLSMGVSIAMSYVYWSRDPDRHSAGAQPE